MEQCRNIIDLYSSENKRKKCNFANMTTFHPLLSDIPAPEQFTFPFCYEPHPLARLACDELQRYLTAQEQWKDELEKGKMFGVLVVRDTAGTLGFLAAFSGLLAGSNRLDYFVPAVYDLLQPDGHFKQGEKAITDLNHRIAQLTQAPDRLALIDEIKRNEEKWNTRILAQRQLMVEAKKIRDKRRQEDGLQEKDKEEMIRQSQHQKAELKRMRQAAQEEKLALEAKLKTINQEIEQMKQQRKQMSDELQRWIFDQYKLLNARGETRTVNDIFYKDIHAVPPSGTGECCAPKLLQWAYSHHYEPVCMAEFWWGLSPKTEVRHHLHFYPACRSKCKPLLDFMLQGLKVEPNPLATIRHAGEPTVVYEDEWLAVVSKPSGMLSVPGKDGLISVYSWAAAQWPEANGPLIVHRLDMDTSGLMVIAKSKEVHQALQAEFISHEVKKRYMAVLNGTLAPNVKRDGTIDLPLRPDLDDRPRQLVDPEHGKRAITSYHVMEEHDGKTLIALYPHTGRTHQLRVHCAHHEGLGCPIQGDPLYGKPSDRLYLHAEEIRFRHPVTNRKLVVTDPANFSIRQEQ